MDNYNSGERRGGGDRGRFGGPKKFGGTSRFGGGRDRGGFSGGRDRGGFGGGRSEMHKATCASCGKNCEVPFRPTGDRPVYCNDCFGVSSDTRAPQKSFDTSFDKRFNREPAREPVKTNPLKQEILELNIKLDTIIKLLGGAQSTTYKKESSAPAVAEKVEKKSDVKEIKKVEKKAKDTKKKAPVKAKTINKKKK